MIPKNLEYFENKLGGFALQSLLLGYSQTGQLWMVYTWNLRKNPLHFSLHRPAPPWFAPQKLGKKSSPKNILPNWRCFLNEEFSMVLIPSEYKSPKKITRTKNRKKIIRKISIDFLNSFAWQFFVTFSGWWKHMTFWKSWFSWPTQRSGIRKRSLGSWVINHLAGGSPLRGSTWATSKNSLT